MMETIPWSRLCRAKTYDGYLYIFTLINIIIFFIALFANGTDPTKLILLKALAPHLVNKNQDECPALLPALVSEGQTPAFTLHVSMLANEMCLPKTQ